ncbi:Glycosyl hydrolase family protein isoform 3 [Tripterygium wilfordii]|uniref:Glycosyl hydrolase family protein isoform 3 n=1 Tax=Tripterygium wilfordii TaxID=458696 RepID=A0A7J7DKH1_TRIWF|nr:Glycosyl hydrolase family protein isoform 3 [Tripterygium wilfordii]
MFLKEISGKTVFEKSNVAGFRLVSELSAELCEKRKFSVTVGVQNNGEITGKHPVLLFVKQTKLGSGRPIKKLIGFQSVKLKAGQRYEIKFQLNACEHLSIANEEGKLVIEDGPQVLNVGEEEYPITIIV